MKQFFHPLFQNWRRMLFTVFVSALLTRVVFVSTLQDGYYFPDSVEYSAAAISLLASGELGEAYSRPPAYPVFLAAIYLVFGESIFATRIVESVVGAFLAVIIALIGRRIGGEVVGFLAGMLWGIYPLGIFIAGLVYPENLLTMLLACGLLCFLPDSAQEPSRARMFLAGVLWGLAALTKPVVLATVGAASFWLILYSPAKRTLLVPTLFLGTGLVVVPWAIRDYYVYDQLVVIEPRAVGHLPKMPGSRDKVEDNRIQAILKQPADFASHFQREFRNFWKIEIHRITMDWPSYREALHKRDPRVVKTTIFTTNDLINAISMLTTGPLFLFAILGTAAMLLQQKQRRHFALLWLTILSFAVVYSMFWAKTRYRIPIEPYIIILAAYGMTAAWRTVKRSRFEVRGSTVEQVEPEVNASAEGVRSSTFDAGTG